MPTESEDRELPHVVFFYGTLKRGGPNTWFTSDPKNGQATYIGTAVTVNKYPLVVGSAYNIPFILRAEGRGQEIEGELFALDDTMMEKVDEFEDHPNFYFREEAEVEVTQDRDGNDVNPPVRRTCWIYFLPKYKPEMLDLPCYRSYSSVSKDHPPYVPRHLRPEVNSYEDL